MSKASLKRVVKTVRTAKGSRQQTFWVKTAPTPLIPSSQTVRIIHEHELSARQLVKGAKRAAFTAGGAVAGGVTGYYAGGHVGRVYGHAQTGLKTGGKVGAWAGRNLGAAGGTLAGTSLGYALGRHYVR